MPRFDDVVIDVAKLERYCLSETHPRGRHKARVFRTRLGIAAADAMFLSEELSKAAKNGTDTPQPTVRDRYGQRYLLDFDIVTSAGSARIRSLWIVRTGENLLRFVTCYVL